MALNGSNIQVVDKAPLTLRMQRRVVTFRAVTEIAGFSRFTLYRSAGLRELVQKHRAGSAQLRGCARFLGISAQFDVLASRSWNQEEALLQREARVCDKKIIENQN